VSRRRNKEKTREVILEAARTVLASDGPDALSLSKVANLAGINRGTAYQHFETREDLIKATVDWVGEHLSSKVFRGLYLESSNDDQDPTNRPIFEVISDLVEFAVEKPALARIWLFEVLASDAPDDDLFFRQFEQVTQELADSPISQDGIDVEALSVIMLAGYFLWPVWVKARVCTKEDRQEMIKRMRREVLRLFMYGVLRPQEFPNLQEILEQ